jgi:hypothetical protein
LRHAIGFLAGFGEVARKPTNADRLTCLDDRQVGGL